MKRFITYFLFVVCTAFPLWADLDEEFYSTHLELLNSSISGTEFYFTVPPALTDINPSNDKVYIYITSSFDTKVTIENKAKNFTKSINIEKGKRGEFVLEPNICQPYIKSGMDPEVGSRYLKSGAMHIISEHPINVKVIVDYKSSSEGFLLYPITALGRNYVVSSYNDGSSLYPLFNSFPSTTCIVALYDNTDITFTFWGNKQSGGGLMYGNKSIMPMNKGDVWVICAQGKESDLSGSTIQASKQVAVISGCQSANVPINNKYNNYLAEMDLPIRWWGNEYHVAKIKGRKNTPIIRIYTLNESQNDTTIVYVNGVKYKDTIIINKNISQFFNFAEYRPKEDEVTIESNKKIAVTLYNTGSQEDGQPTPLGAPFQMSLMPVNSYSHTSSFFIESSALSNPLSKCYLNIMAECNQSEDLPQDLFIGKVDGTDIQWKPIKDAYVISSNEMPSTSGSYKSIVIQMHEPGYYVMKSGRNFGNYCYNFIENKAFGYPAFMTFTSQEELDKTPPDVTYLSECPGEITGTVKDMPEESLLRSNLSSAVFDLKNFSREITQITPGTTRYAEWSLYVKNKKNDAEAIVQFRDYAGNDTILKFNYIAPKISIEPIYKHFGAFAVNEKSTESFNIKNYGSIDFLISKIILKSINSNFKIINPDINKILKPGESYNFQVEFTATNPGSFVDSIGIINPCYLNYLGKIEAAVGQPVIDVTDVDFATQPISSNVVRDGIIFNKGISDLVISGIDSSNSPEFSLILQQEINSSKPLIIKPGGSYSFKISYYTDTKGVFSKYYIFKSNATQIDSTCFVNVRSINIELNAESYNFGRKRMNRTEFPIIPYPILNEYGGLILENIGDKNITIENFELENSVRGEAFEFNKNVLRNLEIKTKSKFVLPVRFNPKDTGIHELTINYKLKGLPDSKVYSKLSGIGCVPKIKCERLDFDTLFQSEAIHSKQIVIKNLPYTEWKWADTLYIYDFDSDSSILFDANNFSKKGFRLNKENISLPYTLLPGQDMLVDIDFYAGNAGVHSGSLNIISDAENQDSCKSDIYVYVISNNIEFTGGEIYSCMNQKAKIEGHLSNNTQNTIKLKGITFDQVNNEFTLLDKTLESNFILEPGEIRPIPIEYAPKTPGDKTVRLILQDEESQFYKFTEFKGKTTQLTRFISTTPINQKIEPGKPATISITLENGPRIDTFYVYNMNFKLNYNTNILSLQKKNIFLGDLTEGKFKLNIEEYNNKEGIVKFNISSVVNEPINNPGKLIDFVFDTHIPFEKNYQAYIDLSAETFDSDCVIFSCTDGIITLENTCMSDILQIISSGFNYQLDLIAPNPVQSNSISLNFQIAFENNTKIHIYKSDGKAIKQFEYGELKPGNYSKTIDLDGISNGQYFIIIESGSFSAVRKMIINK